MQMKKRVAVLCGGKSTEHEVSLLSARNIVQALDRAKYDPILIGIDKDGIWRLYDDFSFLLSGKNPKEIVLSTAGKDVVFVPGGSGKLVRLSTTKEESMIDVVFPILHGPCGEDGTVQGLLELAGVPFVGAGVCGAAVGMDKDVMKRLLRDAGIPIGRFLTLHRNMTEDFSSIAKELGAPFFIKPARAGSSVGVHKVKNERDFGVAVADAFRYDTKIIAEEYIAGREIECAVLGNDELFASVPGEIIVHHEFYSYEAKYVDANGATTDIPAKISPSITEEVRSLARKTFEVLGCKGMGRVDFFLREDGTLFVNEINVLPGFTAISMYPKLLAASGISQSDLIDRLIQLACDRFAQEEKLATSYQELT